MKRILLLLIILLAANTISFAQKRFIARGATPGELYLSSTWYIIYDPYVGPPYLDSVRKAVFHITENGKKITIPYNVEIIRNTIPMGSYMEPFYILSDATLGVVYMQCHYTKSNYEHTSLWVSFDYGKNWIHREENKGDKSYFPAIIEGMVYRGGLPSAGQPFKSIDYGENFNFIETNFIVGEAGFIEEEFFYVTGSNLYQYQFLHTYNAYNTYSQIPIDSQFVYGSVSGIPPDVYRGGLPEEVYVSSWFPGYQYKVSFSADTGHTFRHVYESEQIHLYNVGSIRFMSDREPGVFYIVTTSGVIDYEPLGEHLMLCVEHYRDYGETLVATYCHDLHKNYGKTCEAVNDLAAEKINDNSFLLSWSEPESSLPVTAYSIYRNNELQSVTTNTTYTDENLLTGNYDYFVITHYEMDCVSDSSNHVKIEIEVGIKEKGEGRKDIVLYPNPTIGELTIESGELRIESVEIFDVYGRKILVPTLTVSRSYDLTVLQPGIYFVRLVFEGGSSVKKLVKQ